MPGSSPRQGVKEPPLGFVHATAILGVLHPYLPLCPHVVPLEMQTVLSASGTKSTPMVQGGLCVIYHNLGEENTPKYQAAVKTYKNVLGPMGHELDLGKMCGQESEPAQAVLPLLYIGVWMSPNHPTFDHLYQPQLHSIINVRLISILLKFYFFIKDKCSSFWCCVVYRL